MILPATPPPTWPSLLTCTAPAARSDSNRIPDLKRLEWQPFCDSAAYLAFPADVYAATLPGGWIRISPPRPVARFLPHHPPCDPPTLIRVGLYYAPALPRHAPAPPPRRRRRARSRRAPALLTTSSKSRPRPDAFRVASLLPAPPVSLLGFPSDEYAPFRPALPRSAPQPLLAPTKFPSLYRDSHLIPVLTRFDSDASCARPRLP
jgi:hypothetical protein